MSCVLSGAVYILTFGEVCAMQVSQENRSPRHPLEERTCYAVGYRMMLYYCMVWAVLLLLSRESAKSGNW